MSSGSTSARPRPHRRGLISCLHSPTCRANDDEDAPPLLDQDLPQAIYKLILGFYEKAFDRLPCETMPDLPRLLGTSGFCLGLLDPVSNIILNTIALLPDDAVGRPPAPKRSKRLARAALPGSDRGGCPWREAAIRSYYSLLDFLITYFGCLSMEQAIRYLYRAGADLALAAMLVQHDLHKHDMDLQPASARTQTALKWVADRAGHADPDTLAQVMAIRLQDDAFANLKALVPYGSVLTPDDVRYVHRLLHSLITPPCHAQVNHAEEDVVVCVSRNLDGVSETTDTVKVYNTDGSTTTRTKTTIRRLGQPITSMRRGLGGMLSKCLELAYREEDALKSQCGDDCEYLESLKMCAHGMIHSFYIDALKLLPSPSGSLMRTILMAGHCYGCLDPVSNIIVNTIFYQKRDFHVEEPAHENIEPYTDILDPLSLLRPVVRSLKGLTALAAFADALFSIPGCALETICCAKCNIANMLPSPGERFQNNPFHEAAMAVGYPLPLQLGELHQQLLLMPVERKKLLSLITEAGTSCTVLPIDDISFILGITLSRTRCPVPILSEAPKLCVEALSVVSKKRSQYEARRGVFRRKIEQLLEEYTSQHFWEPKYNLNFICGVEEIGRGPSSYYNKCYHVNFMATSEPQLQKTLFFAEFWHSHEPKPSFCCPLPSAYAGRCYYGVDSARKLAYPDREEYILCDITERGTRNVHDMIETDIVYFSPERDVDVAKKLNKYYAGDFPVARRPAVLWC